jgi:hypothetical protein
MMTAMSGMLSPSRSSPTRTVILARCSPAMGELVVVVSWVSGREEDHVIAVAKRHELQALKPNHRSQRKWTFRISHLEKRRENSVDTQHPLPDAPTISVRTQEGPKPTSEFVLRVLYSEW